MLGCHFSHVQLFVTPWTVAHQAPLSTGFSRQEHWSRLPCPPPGNLADPGIKFESPELAGESFITEPPGKPLLCYGLHRPDFFQWEPTAHALCTYLTNLPFRLICAPCPFIYENYFLCPPAFRIIRKV